MKFNPVNMVSGGGGGFTYAGSSTSVIPDGYAVNHSCGGCGDCEICRTSKA